MKRVTITSLFLMGVMLNVLAQSPDLSLRNVKSNDITFDDIQYWVGSGSNRCIMIVNWCEPQIAFAWGYRFESDSLLVSQLLDDIAQDDPRFAYVDGGGYITEITYQDSTYTLALKGGYWMYNINEGAVNGISTQYVHPDDMVEFGDESCGQSDTEWVYVWDIPITPVTNPTVDPNAITSIDMRDKDVILYPNPAKDFIYCDFNAWNERIRLTLLDIQGKTLYSQTVDGAEVCKLSLLYFPNGMYFLHLESNTYRQTKKIIIY